MCCMPGSQFYSTYLFLLHQSAQACAMRMLEKRKTLTKTMIWYEMICGDLMGFDGFLHRASKCIKKKQKHINKNVRFWVDLEGCHFIVPKTFDKLPSNQGLQFYRVRLLQNWRFEMVWLLCLRLMTPKIQPAELGHYLNWDKIGDRTMEGK